MSQKNLQRTAQFTRKKIQNYSYGLNDQIGKGYSSQVYRGRNDDTNLPVAIKVIDLNKLKSEINQKLLASEIEILKGMKDYPNVLTLFEVYTTKNNTYIITELCDSDLSHKTKNKLSEADVFGFMKQLLNGYSFIHQAQVIHRDLKPANLLLAKDGTLKVADFGFGISAEEATKATKYNVGSPLYMAPESLRKNQYSYKTDIWAIGIIFFEMLTTETPWKAKDQKQLLKKIQAERIDSILAKRDFSPIAKDFISKALNMDKNQRMTPEQLIQYSLIQGPEQQIPNILSEKKLNLTFKYETLVSQVSTPHRSKDNKLRLYSEKSEKRILNPVKSVNIKMQAGSLCDNLKKTESHQQMKSVSAFGKDNLNPQTVSPLKKQDKKSISKILIAEVHFCRFLYKLLMKIKGSTENGILFSADQSPEILEIFTSYTKLIKFKLQKITNFSRDNFMNLKEENYVLYQETSDFRKLVKISKEYTERYSKQLPAFWRESALSGSGEIYTTLLDNKPTSNLMALLKQHLEVAVGAPSSFCTAPYTHKRKLSHFSHENGEQPDTCEENVARHSKDIVILDYLMTARQLLDILRENPNDHQKFARKSRIDEIVEGSTAQIDYPLYVKIIERASALLERDYSSVLNLQRDNYLTSIGTAMRCSASVSPGINANEIETRYR